MSKKQNETAVAETPAVTEEAKTLKIGVFARFQNVVDAIISKANLGDNVVQILAGDDNEGWKEAGTFDGRLYTTEQLGQRTGVPTIRVPMFPKGVKTPKNLGTGALAKSLAAKAKNDALSAQRDRSLGGPMDLGPMEEPPEGYSPYANLRR